ncbi:MAG: NUDIX hydrolase [Patescibacteria group bacterium]|nr:NUDIX hydrolase [Patescibacteria group bacterium]
MGIEGNANVSCGVIVSRGEPRIEEWEALFLERENGKFCFPSGHWEVGEDLPACAAREFCEETGYEVALLGTVGIYTLEPKTGGVPSLGVVYYGVLGEKVGEPEGGLCWLGTKDMLLMHALRHGLFLPWLHLLGFFESCARYPAFLPLDIFSSGNLPRNEREIV